MIKLNKDGKTVYSHKSYMDEETVFLIRKLKLINKLKIVDIQ